MQEPVNLSSTLNLRLSKAVLGLTVLAAFAKIYTKTLFAC